ncbi:hypothetical protein SKAU_G00174110 [Synaphobranchus kaupii]|uniref:G-protein coupled receptors family 1 profile domain-containing protein n=1 Tax=Synaphobranchus kaupii TaxID=118154 RepID=A0A9Q1J038_SYNKA|nr:hypothetical protein SKAU_G00174110 [Synaphobranchus kaupii]
MCYLWITVPSKEVILSLLGNSTLLLVAYRKRLSLKPAEFFIVNLSISDLGMTVTLFPLAISSLFAHRWLFDELTCLCYAFCGVLFGLCSLTNLTVLSSVCCLKVCFPSYGRKFFSWHAHMLVAGVWCYASVFAVGPLLRWGHYGPEPYGTACLINWHAPNNELSAMTYIICLFLFCYVLPCTIIFSSYACILLRVHGSRQAVLQHVSLQTNNANAHILIVKLSVAVCIGFLMAWSPYAVVAMWAAFSDAKRVPPIVFALAAIFSKSSTTFNPIVYLLFKPNFRKSMCREAMHLCYFIRPGPARQESRGSYRSTQPYNKDACISNCLSNGQPENHRRVCWHCVREGPP